jgi:hypothetical protein
MKLKLKNEMQTDEIEEEDVVDYLEVTAFDSDGLIFRNPHEKFLAKSSFLNLNSKMVKMTW